MNAQHGAVMTSKYLQLTALSAALFSSMAGAVGFGEITLHSRVGEALRAEVPVIAGADEQIEMFCFSLAPLHGSDLPVVTAARTRLVRDGQNYRLLITGNKSISDPIFMIGLRAGCGADLQRDYVLMPQAPLMLAEADSGAPSAAAITPPKKGNSREWRARDGDTLESIAESQAPDNSSARRRLLAAMKRANPDIPADTPLPEGMAVLIPNLSQPTATDRNTRVRPSPPPRRTDADNSPPPRPKKAAPTDAQAPSPKKGSDRIVLGAPPSELKPGEKAVTAPATLSEMTDRVQKLESTLQLLNQEVDKLNSALTLTAEALAVQHQLQSAQALKARQDAPPAIQTAANTTLATDRSSQGNWFDLLVSALIGGVIAGGLAHVLGRRRRADNDEIPFAMTVHRPEILAHEPGSSVFPTQRNTEYPGSDAPAGTETQAAAPSDTVTAEPAAAEPMIKVNASESALELAEIMISFGRVRGAAETLALYIEENSPQNIQPWTMLLDLYRRGDMRSEFDTLAANMRKKFNVHVPAWEDSTTPVSGLKSLEDYTHIISRSTNCWGTQECLDYLFELVNENRAGQRSGFPLEVVEEIVLLMHVLEDGYGLTRPA